MASLVVGDAVHRFVDVCRWDRLARIAAANNKLELGPIGGLGWVVEGTDVPELDERRPVSGGFEDHSLEPGCADEVGIGRFVGVRHHLDDVCAAGRQRAPKRSQ